VKLTILNTREQKPIYSLLKSQFGFSKKLEYAFLLSEKEKIYIANKEVFEIDMKKLNVSSVGMYFGELRNDELRLSIEGSQLIGSEALKGVVEVDDPTGWMSGLDIPYDGSEKGFVLIKHGDDYLGCGKVVDGKVLNYVGKVRRIHISS
jgi:NOL1/NOP2/fmu family ribosome biogenesis protein|tara:strand:+ start:737 stop:1183 length:447 start_codon:yes stop_codon:yes gene_type:complete